MIAQFPAPRQIEYFVNASKKTLEKQKLVSIILWLAVAIVLPNFPSTASETMRDYYL